MDKFNFYQINKKIFIFKLFFVRNNVIILSQNGIKLKRFYAIYCL